MVTWENEKSKQKKCVNAYYNAYYNDERLFIE